MYLLPPALPQQHDEAFSEGDGEEENVFSLKFEERSGAESLGEATTRLSDGAIRVEEGFNEKDSENLEIHSRFVRAGIPARFDAL